MYLGTDGTVCGQSSSCSCPMQSNHQNINGISKDTTPGDGTISEQGVQSSATMSSAGDGPIGEQGIQSSSTISSALTSSFHVINLQQPQYYRTNLCYFRCENIPIEYI